MIIELMGDQLIWIAILFCHSFFAIENGTDDNSVQFKEYLLNDYCVPVFVLRVGNTKKKKNTGVL